MRWKNKWALKKGQTRIVRKFLWFPKHFYKTPTRWLEFADILEEVDMAFDYPDGPDYPYWFELRFATEYDKKCHEGDKINDQ